VAIKPKLLLLAGALVFWGLQTGFAWVALFLAAIVVAPGLVKHHLSFTHREFARLWDVTLLTLVGAALYHRQMSSISGAVLSFLQWLPMLLFPITAAFLFSRDDRLPYSTFAILGSVCYRRAPALGVARGSIRGQRRSSLPRCG
jgi:xanthine/uracil permease